MPLVQTKLPYRTAAELADIIRVLRDRVAQLERELKEARKQSAAAPPKQTSVLALLMQVRSLLIQGATEFHAGKRLAWLFPCLDLAAGSRASKGLFIEQQPGRRDVQ